MGGIRGIQREAAESFGQRHGLIGIPALQRFTIAAAARYCRVYPPERIG
jgi:hypothetical protein